MLFGEMKWMLWLKSKAKGKTFELPAVCFHAAVLTGCNLNPALNSASPAKGHNIMRSVSVLSNLSVYCGVKQGIYSLNLFKGFETIALGTYHPSFKNINSLNSNHMESRHECVWRDSVGLSIWKNVWTLTAETLLLI